MGERYSNLNVVTMNPEIRQQKHGDLIKFPVPDSSSH